MVKGPREWSPSKPPPSRFLVLSGVGPMDDWTPNDVVIDGAPNKKEAKDIADRAWAAGAETVLLFEWDGEAWALTDEGD